MQKYFYGGMTIKLLKTSSVLLFFLFIGPSIAQDTPPFLTQIRNFNPQQQASYVNEARKRGYSLLQLEALARAQGATNQDLSLLRNAWEENQQSSENQEEERRFVVELPEGNASSLWEKQQPRRARCHCFFHRPLPRHLSFPHASQV